MRIFFVCGDPGVPLHGTKGASIHLRSVAEALHRAGHEVLLLLRAVPDGVPPLLMPVRRMENLQSLLDAAASWGPPDVLYERYAMGHADGLFAARELGCLFALEVNAPLVLEASRHRPQTVQPQHADVERKLLRDADAIFAVSEPLRRYVARERGSEAGTFVLRNGCDPAIFSQAAPLAATDQPVIVFLGHPKPWHGAGSLPPLLAALDERGHRARLVLIGGGKGIAPVLQAADRLGVADRIEVTGPVPPQEAARRLLEATVAVAPYPRDPCFYFCPLKVIECMAAGLPVVTTAQGDLPEILGQAGLLVPPGEVEALVDAVEAVLEDTSLRRRLGALARERALGEMTWQHVATRLVQRLAEANRLREAVA